jgi:putative transposase
MVVALGVDEAGCKHVLGLRQGETENALVVTDLLCDLRDRGVETTRPTLFCRVLPVSVPECVLHDR